MMQNIVVLGSTGSVGQNSLAVLRLHPDRFRVFALGAATSVAQLLAQCEEFRPRYAVLKEAQSAAELADAVAQRRLPTQVLHGEEALSTVAAHAEAEVLVMAVTGARGLAATFAAAQAGKRILLASKEVLVMAGPALCETARRSGARLIPLDSEHNAVLQCLPGDGETRGVRRVWLTASGGPFRGYTKEKLAGVSAQQACDHPTWKMGRKISVDSATMMNKGLEVIEACILFALEEHQLKVVVHPQSIVHSLVEYEDGSVLAQLGNPDMRIPIAHGLGFPQRIASGAPALDLLHSGALTFEAPDEDNFPCLGLARQALRSGAAALITLNAANTVAVEEFLSGRIGFLGIPALVAEVLRCCPAGESAATLPEVQRIERIARAAAVRCLDIFDPPLRTGS